ANADDEALTASRYEELLKKAGLEIALLVNSKSS
nr:Myc-type, basic helix-loop-helix (bHLH) domain-containing protein [Tanacetum cinerariifolium]